MSPLLLSMLLQIYKWWIIAKMTFYYYWSKIATYTVKNGPDWLINLGTCGGYKGYDINDKRFLWLIKYVSDKHSRLKHFYGERESINIKLENKSFLWDYRIYIHNNKFELIKYDKISNKMGDKCFGHFYRNEIRLLS